MQKNIIELMYKTLLITNNTKVSNSDEIQIAFRISR